METINYNQLWKESRLYITDELDFAPVIIKVDNSIIATLGNFSSSVGKAKSRKTFNVSAMVSSALIGKIILSYSASLPVEKRKILYFDTEQSTYHCQKVLKRIIQTSELNLKIHPENLEFVSLRKFDPATRLRIIEEAISKTERLGLVIIDGIRDLVYDINSPKESTEITSKLLQWSEIYKIHVHVVLHLNKTDDNARGHLGTEILNKAETVLQVVRDPANPNISIVKPMTIRDVEFEPFAFIINNEGIPEMEEDFQISENSLKSFEFHDIPENVHRQSLNKCFEEFKELSYGDLIPKLIESYGEFGYQMGQNKVKNLKKFLENKRILIKQGKSYSYNKNFYF